MVFYFLLGDDFYSFFCFVLAIFMDALNSLCSPLTNMDGEESLLDTIFDDESVGGVQDVDMVDLEDGELADDISRTEIGEIREDHPNQLNGESNKRKLRNKKKKRNKRKQGGNFDSGPNLTDINRFVLGTCKRLKEKKSYLMWNAVGVLGISALSDLVKEVDAIQACGGQKTADGRRFRNGGGVLWNIIKARDPNAYKEIMRKGKEFENQFKKQHHGRPQADQIAKSSFQDTTRANVHVSPNVLDSETSHIELSIAERKRVPVKYDDLVVEEHAIDDSTAFDR